MDRLKSSDIRIYKIWRGKGKGNTLRIIHMPTGRYVEKDVSVEESLAEASEYLKIEFKNKILNNLNPYCPKCGKIMIDSENGYYCEFGDMYLAPILSKAFRIHYIEKSEPPPKTTSTSGWNWGGTWFCPTCSNKMNKRGGKVLCENCGSDITSFLHLLIELHPHKNDDKNI